VSASWAICSGRSADSFDRLLCTRSVRARCSFAEEQYGLNVLRPPTQSRERFPRRVGHLRAVRQTAHRQTARAWAISFGIALGAFPTWAGTAIWRARSAGSVPAR